MSVEKSRRLGRGLEALIGAAQPGVTASPELQKIPVARIRPNPYQPRREFPPQELAELQASIEKSGLLQPVTVRKTGELYELVAGERRLRAITNLGWKDVPAIVRDFDDQTLLVLALVENLQRSDLNPLEEARGYQRLLTDFNLTHQQVADAVGKDRTTITNLLRVLTLPQAVQQAVEVGHLSVGHARAILSLDNEAEMITLANEVVAKSLSVRETEHRARLKRTADAPEPRTATPNGGRPAQRDPALVRIEDDLRRYLQTDVAIELTGAEKGSLRIRFYSTEDLDRLLDLVLRENRGDFT